MLRGHMLRGSGGINSVPKHNAVPKHKAGQEGTGLMILKSGLM